LEAVLGCELELYKKCNTRDRCLADMRRRLSPLQCQVGLVKVRVQDVLTSGSHSHKPE